MPFTDGTIFTDGTWFTDDDAPIGSGGVQNTSIPTDPTNYYIYDTNGFSYGVMMVDRGTLFDVSTRGGQEDFLLNTSFYGDGRELLAPRSCTMLVRGKNEQDARSKVQELYRTLMTATHIRYAQSGAYLTLAEGKAVQSFTAVPYVRRYDTYMVSVVLLLRFARPTTIRATNAENYVNNLLTSTPTTHEKSTFSILNNTTSLGVAANAPNFVELRNDYTGYVQPPLSDVSFITGSGVHMSTNINLEVIIEAKTGFDALKEAFGVYDFLKNATQIQRSDVTGAYVARKLAGNNLTVESMRMRVLGGNDAYLSLLFVLRTKANFTSAAEAEAYIITESGAPVIAPSGALIKTPNQ